MPDNFKGIKFIILIRHLDLECALRQPGVSHYNTINYLISRFEYCICFCIKCFEMDLSGSPHLKNIGKATRLVRFVLSFCALLRVVPLSIEMYFDDLIVSIRIFGWHR